MAMLSVRTNSQGLYGRTFAFYMSTKKETTNFGTGAQYVLAGAILHAAVNM
jgi:hypothetical protein